MPCYSFFGRSPLKKKMNLDAIAVFIVSCCIFRDGLSQIARTTYSSKPSEKLDCSISSDTESSVWQEVASNGSTLATVYEYKRDNGITPESPPPGKYNNFRHNFIQDVNFDLIIEHVNKNDGGIYRCTNLPQIDSILYTVTVEALPDSITIVCTNLESCSEASEMRVSNFNCICTASEVSPDSLELIWSGAPFTPTPTRDEPAGDYFNLIREASVNPEEGNDEITCSVSGYQSEGIEGTLNKTYEFASPDCTLLIDCSSAMLTCSCRGQNPPQITYIFYNENMELIETSIDNQIEIDTYIVPGKNNTFSCQGCNGIFYGKSSLVSNTTDCPVSTTTIPTTTTETTTTVTTPNVTNSNSPTTDNATSPTLMKTEMPTATTTPTMTLMATSPPESDNLGLIIGVVIAAVVVGGGAIGFSVYWFGIRTSSRKRSVTGSNNLALRGGNTNPSYTEPAYDEVEKDTQAKSTVTASTNETTNSAAPVYGVVNKSTKKKSDNTDGNGVNSKLQSEPDQVEYAAVNKPKSDPQPAPRSSKPPGNNTEPEKVELQYADIDHSNRGRSNEIHQPADAPTEYATVQSVIV